MEDDPVLRTFLADNLTADGYELIVAETVRDGLRELEYKRPDLAIVDLGLPDGSGLELIARVRAADGVASRLDPTLPLVVLSGRATSSIACAGSSAAADDFVAKPFSYARAARCGSRAVLRRTHERRGRGRLRVGELELDPPSREVRAARRAGSLSQKEFALLRALAAEPTRVLTKEELLRDVWGFRVARHDPHARLARLPPAPEARRRRRPLRRERVGRRLPAGRRPGGGGDRRRDRGWLALLALGARARARCTCAARQRLVLAARAGHEVRGPLCAARLALDGLERSARVEAIDLELRRAALALDDLAGARRGRRGARAAAGRRRRPPAAPRPRTRGSALAGVHGADARDRPPRGGRCVRGDRLRLAQACGNLLANAVEHGGGRVSVRARAAGAARPDRGRRRRSRPPGADPRARRRGARAPRPGAVTASRSPPRSPSATAAGSRRRRRRAAPAALDLPSRGSPRGARSRARAVTGGRARCCSASRWCSARWRPRTSRAARRRCATRSGRWWPWSSPRARSTRAAGSRRRTSRSGACPSGSRPRAGPLVPELVVGQRLAVPVPAGAPVGEHLLARAPRRPAPAVRRGERAVEVVATGSPAASSRGRASTSSSRASAAAAAATRSSRSRTSRCSRPAPAPARDGGGPQVAATLRVTVRQAVYLAAAGAFARDIRLLARAPGDHRLAGRATGRR